MGRNNNYCIWNWHGFMKEGISTGIISLVSGAVIELISGTILVLAKYEMNSKDKYFETLSKTEDHRH